MLTTLHAELALSAPAQTVTPSAPAVISAPDSDRLPVPTREQPMTAMLASRRLLNKPGSRKETWHIEIEAAQTSSRRCARPPIAR
jgi:sulfite reductase (NADPH) flavoprotein alpha-component